MQFKRFTVFLILFAVLFLNLNHAGLANEIPMENPNNPANVHSITGMGPFGGPADYDSGWTDIETNQEILFNHNLGGNPNNYVIDLHAFNNVQGSHQYLYGIDSSYRTDHLEFHGFYWYAITTGSIKVKRAYADIAVSQVRIRIWVVPSADFDTGWMSLNKGEERTIDHYLGGDPDEYVVDFQLMHNGGLGVNNISYGMDAYYDNGTSYKELGAAWSALDNKSINVKRTSDDYTADNLRVRIWRVSDQDYDSGWKKINSGASLTLNHNLGGPWNDFKVDIQFKHSGQYGTHQINYGGDITFFNGMRSDTGAFISNLNNNQIRIVREFEDAYVDEVRVRIWVNPAPKYDSGWQSIAKDEFKTLNHNLGGDPDHYLVDMQFKDTVADGQSGRGVSQMNYGGDDFKGLPSGNTQFHGVYWWGLTDSYIKVHRQSDDMLADEVRVRIWIPPAPSFDSGWSSISPNGVEENFNHSVGGDLDDYVIDMQFKDSGATGAGVNQKGYGWNYYRSSSTSDLWTGAAWSHLDNASLSVIRALQDTAAEQVRIRIWVNPKPDYDSNWTLMDTGKSEDFTHNLGGNPDDYVLDLQFMDDIYYDVNQIYYGGNLSYETNGSTYREGTFWSELSTSTVTLIRQKNDAFADNVRVRIWKIETPIANAIYLPLLVISQ